MTLILFAEMVVREPDPSTAGAKHRGFKKRAPATMNQRCHAVLVGAPGVKDRSGRTIGLFNLEFQI